MPKWTQAHAIASFTVDGQIFVCLVDSNKNCVKIMTDDGRVALASELSSVIIYHSTIRTPHNLLQSTTYAPCRMSYIIYHSHTLRSAIIYFKKSIYNVTSSHRPHLPQTHPSTMVTLCCRDGGIGDWHIQHTLLTHSTRPFSLFPYPSTMVTLCVL